MALSLPAPSRAEVGPFPVRWSPLLIAGDHCKGCELCVAACPKSCLALDAGTVNRLGYHPVTLTAPAACTSCAFCARVCPDAVFTIFAAPKEAAR
jgi:2-oxoglutarate ferredoxin oxidoreductase subunit delta